MRKKIPEPHFIVDEKGKQVSVVLDVRFYRAIIEELEDLHDTLKAERVIAKTRKLHRLEDLEKKLRAQGKL